MLSGGRASDILHVVLRLGPRAVACLAVLGVLGLDVLPPEHVHLGVDLADHVRLEVLHRHYAPHHPTFNQTHVEPGENEATYLSDAFTMPTPAAAQGPDEASFVLLADGCLPLGATQWHPVGRDLRAHAPPWAYGYALRGPPSLS